MYIRDAANALQSSNASTLNLALRATALGGAALAAGAFTWVNGRRLVSEYRRSGGAMPANISDTVVTALSTAVGVVGTTALGALSLAPAMAVSQRLTENHTMKTLNASAQG